MAYSPSRFGLPDFTQQPRYLPYPTFTQPQRGGFLGLSSMFGSGARFPSLLGSGPGLPTFGGGLRLPDFSQQQPVSAPKPTVQQPQPASAPTPGATPTAEAAAPTNTSGYVFPVQGYKGKINAHHGVATATGGSDIFAAYGTPVLAMRGGRVISAGYDNTGGNYVLVQGDDGNKYYYAHLQNTPLVATGQTIQAGVQLGGVGDTGNAKGTGAHLHLGIGPSIQNGTGPNGGIGSNFDAITLLSSLLN